ncbi:DsbE family thiol:disulfide interchange protein [Rhodovulum sulfidophilum]|uniref:DsbE family thiol:disulfide interchange protein n=1 Tax=Rhodovulum sulfidophilum TaxID=35806 RepID=UPI00117A3C18|nr:DsbE family thiol:disulfide interchange protein [Rhodovulum sulfidophilum]MBL3553322.1 DsbE family thiol:disulfide interchange protein [Rhodovulum sulfidophilum]
MSEKRRISPLLLLPPVLFAGLAALFFIGMTRDDPDALPSMLIGKPAPALALSDLAGQGPFDAATLADGNIKLVNFWASWCAPCRQEHPELETLAGTGVEIYGINYKDDPTKAMRFLDELGNPFVALGADPSGRTAIEWGVYGVPETFVIDGEGTVLLRHPGPLTPAIVEAEIRPLLDNPPTTSN